MGYRQPAVAHAAILVRQDDSATWTPDTVVSIQLSPSWQITDHPVEQGVSVSDHIRRQPAAMTITCIVTETPTTGTGGAAHVREKLAWLLETADAGQLVDVVTTKLGTFTGYAIQSAPHAIDNVARLEFALQLREVRIATSTTVQIDLETVTSDVATSAPPEVHVGEQPTTNTATDEAAEDVDRSWLATTVDWLGA